MVSDGADWARHDERVGGPHVASPAGSPTRSAGDPAEAARREPEWSRLVAVHERMTAKIPTPRDRKLSRHDTFALLSKNRLRYYEAYWALQ